MSKMNHRKVVRGRRQLAQRDGGDRCYFCREPFARPGKEVTVDHLVPESRGGTHDLANLALACATCNRRKGSMTAEEFLATRYIAYRHRVREARERRERTHSHAAIRFADGGWWSCDACGSDGPRTLSPTLMPCAPGSVSVPLGDEARSATMVVSAADGSDP